jgi:GAF domain-containing protein
MNDQAKIHPEAIDNISVLKQEDKEIQPSKTWHKQEDLQYLAVEILAILNDPSALADSIHLILDAIKRKTGFDAVGIRLRSGDDFPYFVQNGFSHDFLLTENSLIERDAQGSPCRDANGNISLECTCGLVISGKTDQTNPLFTEGGSCWTNNSLPLLDLPADQDPRLHPRNNCIHQGFCSVALIPIRANRAMRLGKAMRGKAPLPARAHREIIGLLQLNDRRNDCFTLDMIRFFEGIGESIGIALMRKQAEEEREKLIAELQMALAEVRKLSGMLPICASCKKIRDDKGYWNQIESYIRDHSEAEFSHGICPDCVGKLYPELYGEKLKNNID